jgi:hypothetical protein
LGPVDDVGRSVAGVGNAVIRIPSQDLGKIKVYWNDFCYIFAVNVKPMKKLLLFTAFLLYWATAAFADNLSYLPDHSGYTSTLMLQSYEQPEKEIEIFPNPVTEGRLTLTTSENIRTVQILNITGKMVYSQDYPPGTLTATVELDKPEKGIYLVRISFADNTTHTEKIMVK